MPKTLPPLGNRLEHSVGKRPNSDLLALNGPKRRCSRRDTNKTGSYSQITREPISTKQHPKLTKRSSIMLPILSVYIHMDHTKWATGLIPPALPSAH
ncbi:hypothetical protein TNCV_5033711 [Trichonephila clavipes]|nr:hypothetical protein TNCV_5033711 [Trichonephila clavipes]